MPSYLVEFHRLSGNKTLTAFDDQSEAMRARVQRELNNDDLDTEIVVINSPSLEDLKITHSRYFASEPTSVASSSKSVPPPEEPKRLTG